MKKINVISIILFILIFFNNTNINAREFIVSNIKNGYPQIRQENIKDIDLSKEYYVFTYGIFVDKGKLFKTGNNEIFINLNSKVNEIIPDITTIRDVETTLFASIFDSIYLSAVRFFHSFRSTFIINPIIFILTLLLVIIIANFIKTMMIPQTQIKWRKKIINDITELNRQSIEFVEIELKELPDRLKLALARSYVYGLPVTDLINVRGIGKVTIEKLMTTGFKVLGEADKFRIEIRGIGQKIEESIYNYINENIKQAFADIKSGSLQYSNKEIVDYFENYKKTLLQQQVTLEGDVNDIVELTDQLEKSQAELEKIDFKHRLKLYTDRQKTNLKNPGQNIKIFLNFILNSLVFFFVPFALFLVPGVKIYTIFYLGIWSSFIAACFFLIKHNLFPESAMLGIGSGIDPTNLKEQRLQLEALKMSMDYEISTPLVRIIPNKSYNAFAGGGRFIKSFVGIHSSLVNDFQWDETRAIMGHEMTHLKHGDSRMYSTFNTTISILDYLIIIVNKIYYLLRDVPIVNIFLFIFSWVNYLIISAVRIITIVIKFSISRAQEFRADIGGAMQTSYETMASSLRRILNTPNDENYYPAYRSSYIADVSSNFTGIKKYTERLFSTHPSIEKRIMAMESYNNKIKVDEIPIKKVSNLKKLLD